MQEIRQTQKKYGSRAMFTAIIVALCFIIAGYKPIAKGLILGTLFSILNFVLIGIAIPILLNNSKRKTIMVSFGSVFLRLMIMAVPLVIAVKYESFNVFSVIPGLLMIQIIIIADNLFVWFRRTKTEKKV